MISDNLYEFLVTARCGSISKASSEVGIAQSALSRHLASLESTLGVTLLERGKSGVTLTRDGRYVYESAKPLFEIGEDIRRHYLFSINEGRERDILVGGLTRAMRAMEAFEKAREKMLYSGYSLNVSYLSPSGSESLFRGLREKSIDIAVTFEAGWEDHGCDEFRCVELYSENPLVVVEKIHPFAGMDSVGPPMLMRQMFAREAGSSGVFDDEWHEFARACRKLGFNPLSRVIGYERSAGMYLAIPDYVMIAAPSCSHMASSDPDRFSVLRANGLDLSVVAVTRSNDDLACRFVDESLAGR